MHQPPITLNRNSTQHKWISLNIVSNRCDINIACRGYTTMALGYRRINVEYDELMLKTVGLYSDPYVFGFLFPKHSLKIELII